MKAENYLKGRGIDAEIICKNKRLLSGKFYQEKVVLKALELKEIESIKKWRNNDKN